MPEVGIGPGDEYRSYVADGRITIVRKIAGTAKGFQRYVAGDPTVSDEESLEDALKGHATVGRLSTIATKADGL